MNCQLKIQNGTNKIIRGPRATVLSQPSSFRPHWLQQQEASHGDKGLIIPTCNEAIIKMFNLGHQDQGGPKWPQSGGYTLHKMAKELCYKKDS
jgi:hypothetical protein